MRAGEEAFLQLTGVSCVKEDVARESHEQERESHSATIEMTGSAAESVAPLHDAGTSVRGSEAEEDHWHGGRKPEMFLPILPEQDERSAVSVDSVLAITFHPPLAWARTAGKPFSWDSDGRRHLQGMHGLAWPDGGWCQSARVWVWMMVS